MRASVVVIVVASAALALGAPSRHSVDHVVATPIDPHGLAGWRVYDRYCLACHGTKGDGRGPAAPFTRSRPRIFSRGDYEWKSTPTGQPPTDDDLRIAIRYGAAGTSMPPFADVLTATDVENLIEILKAFEPATFAVVGTPIAYVNNLLYGQIDPSGVVIGEDNNYNHTLVLP